MYAYIYSMTKVISISDDVYSSLKTIKKQQESFSMIIRKLVRKEKEKGLISLAGAWKDNEEIAKIMKKIIEDRKEFKLRD